MRASDADSLHSKVAAVTLGFWVMKIAATTLGETTGDLLSMTLNLGYVASSAILLAIFAGLLGMQLSARRFHPVLFWSVVLATSTAGTTMSDLIDRTLGLGYATGASLLAGCLALVLLAWRMSEKSISVSNIASRRAAPKASIGPPCCSPTRSAPRWAISSPTTPGSASPVARC
ncbi:hypothetical protein [Stenotrophomonas maltophilia]|uniref:hypothetical protein n=1 Tax=Stenotrophomonas maltophilia TaxID=40324 RepID=UPI001F2795A1|nr:hypothetical protein [Stenotrophomonas maltophilia]